MNIKLTKNANDYRLLRGISIAEIEEIIANGIHSIDKLGISSRKDNLTVIYSKIEPNLIIKRLMQK